MNECAKDLWDALQLVALQRQQKLLQDPVALEEHMARWKAASQFESEADFMDWFFLVSLISGEGGYDRAVKKAWKYPR